MAKKTNTNITTKSGEYSYFKIKRKVGMKQNKRGEWVPEYKQFYGASQKEALSKYEAYMSNASLDSMTCLGAFFSWYSENIFSEDKSLKTSTKNAYINGFSAVFDGSKVMGRPIKDITGADLQAVLSSSSSAPSTCNQALKMLRRFYKYLEGQKLSADITRGIIAPSVESKRKNQDIEVFTDAELSKFRDNMPDQHRLRLLIVLAINTGARIAELLALTYDDIKADQVQINKSLLEVEPVRGSGDKTRVFVSETKTISSIRSVPITPETYEEVMKHKSWHRREMVKNGYRSNYVFTTSTGKFYYKSTIRKSFKRLCKLVGVEPRPFHTFRHTFGSRLAANHVPIQTVSKLMGHADISVTSKYYVNIPEDEKTAAIETLGNRATG